MKILVCIPDMELAQAVFSYVVEIVRKAKFKGEVSKNGDYEMIRQQISANCYEYDIYLLDAIDRNCLEIARYVRSRNLISSIVFVAINANMVSNILIYRPSAIITKMEDLKQLKDAVLWAYKEQIAAKPFFTIKNKDAIMRVNYSDILWFESRQRIVTLHSKKKEITFYAKLNEVYESIPKDMFLRCHQSYIVNCNMISRIDKTKKCIHLINGKVIEISKSYYQEVISFANQYRF